MTTATTPEAPFSPAIPLDDHGHVEAHQGSQVAGEGAVAPDHQVRFKARREPSRHLLDARVQAAREFVCTPQ